MKRLQANLACDDPHDIVLFTTRDNPAVVKTNPQASADATAMKKSCSVVATTQNSLVASIKAREERKREANKITANILSAVCRLR